MMGDKSIGQIGEELAEKYLQEKGYRIIRKNYRHVLGEIDLIAWDREILVIIEVKTRKSSKYGFPREAVDIYKQQNIIRVTNAFLSEMNLWSVPIRFDVVEIFYSDKPKIEHFKGAFQVE